MVCDETPPACPDDVILSVFPSKDTTQFYICKENEPVAMLRACVDGYNFDPLLKVCVSPTGTFVLNP